MLNLFFPVVVLSTFVIYLVCRRFNTPSLLFMISNASGFLVGALISNLVFSFMLGESSFLLADDRSLFGGGLSWTILLLATIVVVGKTSRDASESAIAADPSTAAIFSTERIVKTLVGPGLLSVGIASFGASIVDLFVFVMYGLIGLEMEMITQPLIRLAALSYVLACIGISLSVFMVLMKRKYRDFQFKTIVGMSAVLPESTIKLWTPSTIGFVTFFFGFPSGILLASINWIRMGYTKKAVYHIVGGLIGILIIIVILFLAPDKWGTGVSALINFGMLSYLNYQTRKDTDAFKASNPETQNAHWSGGCLLGLLGVGFFILIAALVVVGFILLGLPIPQ
jgi:uncharacterized membrane protein